MPRVKFLLLFLDVGDDELEKLFNVFDCDEVRGGFGLLEEEDEADITPLFILQDHFSESEEQPFLSLQRPVVFNRIGDEDLLYLL